MSDESSRSNNEISEEIDVIPTEKSNELSSVAIGKVGQAAASDTIKIFGRLVDIRSDFDCN